MLTALARQGFAPRTILDVGANAGQFTIAARNILRPERLHSFEPLPTAAAALVRRCARYPEVTVHRVALGHAKGVATLRVNSHSQSSSLLPLGHRHERSFPRAKEIATTEVEVARLDELLAREDLLRPAFLKVDAQGYEPKVLEGATGILDSIDHLMIEASFAPLYNGELPFTGLLEAVQDMGYSFLRPVGALTDPRTGEYLQMDLLFERAPSEPAGEP